MPLLLPALLACASQESASTPWVGTDADADGWPAGLDCDDDAWTINPGAPEYCDGTDQDCDGVVDDHPIGGMIAWPDLDQDGWGDENAPDTICEQATGWSTWPGDCDDTDPAVRPDAVETCATAADDDCDGDTNDVDAAGCVPWWADADGDGAGGADEACLCEGAEGWDATAWTDCDDADPDRVEGCGVAGDHLVDELTGVATGRGSSMQAGDAMWALGDLSGDGRPELGVLPRGDASGRLFALSAPFDRPRDLVAADVRLTPASGWRGGVPAPIADLHADGAPQLPWAQCQDSGAFAITLLDLPLSGDVAVTTDDFWLEDHLAFSCLASLAVLDDGDGDGAPELVVADVAGGGLWLFEPAERRGPSLAEAGGLVTDPSGCNGGVATPGDLDGDGLPDLAWGAPCTTRGGAAVGAVNVLLGPVTGGVSTALDVDASLFGETQNAEAGMGVWPAGDVDDDGLADLLVAVPGEISGDAWGVVRVVTRPGRGDADLADVALASAWSAPEDGAPSAAAAADLDLDGVPDLAVGLPMSDRLSLDGGYAALLFGPIAGTLSLGDDDARWFGVAMEDRAGAGLVAIDDATDDGAPGLWIGAPGSDVGATSGGTLYFVPGGRR